MPQAHPTSLAPWRWSTCREWWVPLTNPGQGLSKQGPHSQTCTWPVPGAEPQPPQGARSAYSSGKTQGHLLQVFPPSCPAAGCGQPGHRLEHGCICGIWLCVTSGWAGLEPDVCACPPRTYAEHPGETHVPLLKNLNDLEQSFGMNTFDHEPLCFSDIDSEVARPERV